MNTEAAAVEAGAVGADAIAVVRRNTDEVQGGGDWGLFDQLFADDFVDHTPQRGTTADKPGVLALYQGLRSAFPDFTPEIGWQTVSGDLVTTYKIYRGTHRGQFLGAPATGRSFEIETVDVMRVVDGRITEHWGVANLLKMLTQLGVIDL